MKILQNSDFTDFRTFITPGLTGQGVTVKLRPPIFRKEIENEKKCANFKGNFGLLREMLV